MVVILKWKKYLIFLVISLTSFLCIDKIHAQDQININKCESSSCYTLTVDDTGYYTFTNSRFSYTTQLPAYSYIYWWNYRVYLFTSESEFKYDNNNKKLISVDNSPITRTTMTVYDSSATSAVISSANGNDYNPLYPDTFGNYPYGAYSSFDLYNSRTNQVWFAQNFTISDPIPQITITYSDFNFNVSFDIIDNSRFVYAYRIGNNSNWITYTFGYDQNSFNVPVASNETLYVQVIDSETLEVVRSASYSLSTLTPTITITPIESTDNYVSLRITFGVIDYDSYDYYLKSTGDSEWTYLYSIDSSDNNFDITFTENTTLYVRIVDKTDESIVDSATYTITTITEESSFFESDETNFHGLSSIISFPIRFIRRIVSSNCTPLNLPIPYTGETVQLPCFYSIYQSIGNGALLSIYQLITDGVISYYVIINFLSLIKNMRDPDNDKIEVFEL